MGWMALSYSRSKRFTHPCIHHLLHTTASHSPIYLPSASCILHPPLYLYAFCFASATKISWVRSLRKFFYFIYYYFFFYYLLLLHRSDTQQSGIDLCFYYYHYYYCDITIVIYLFWAYWLRVYSSRSNMTNKRSAFRIQYSLSL